MLSTQDGYQYIQGLIRSLQKENEVLQETSLLNANLVVKYENALNKIANTSGKGMFHNFTVEGHRDSVYIAEVSLDKED